jgi:GntR family transcriptional regulator
MKLWISKNSEVPIHEQLSTQLILGIVSADLAAGERLASTTQLARRFQIHANTVRAAYRDLVNRGWVEWRSGSGFYVRSLTLQEKMDTSLDLDHLIATFLDIAKSRGHGLSEIQARISRWFSIQKPDHIVVIEPDPELREILAAEITEKISMPVAHVSLKEAEDPKNLFGGFCVALYDHAQEVRRALPTEVGCLMLRSRSIAGSLASQSKPSPDTIITVVSRWADFLHWARTTLIAVGLDPNALDLRDAREEGWDRGLTQRSFIVADSLAARSLPRSCRPRIFQVISDESIEELRSKIHGAVDTHPEGVEGD